MMLDQPSTALAADTTPSTRVLYNAKGPCLRKILLHSETVLADTSFHIGRLRPLSTHVLGGPSLQAPLKTVDIFFDIVMLVLIKKLYGVRLDFTEMRI